MYSLAKSSYTLTRERVSIAISLGLPVMDHAVNPFLNFKRIHSLLTYVTVK